MIIRKPQHWFIRLFDWHGSVLSKISFRLSLNVMMSLLALLSLPWYESLNVRLTTAPFSLLGIAIAIFLGFRNNASYARFLEARLLWGTLLINSRTLLRQLHSVLPANAPELVSFSQLLSAYAYALKHQLRGSDGEADLRRLLPDTVYQQVMQSPFRANRLLLCLGESLGEIRREGKLSDILFAELDKPLRKLENILGGCERLDNTPIPFAYTLILHRTVYLFCTLLPFSLVTELHYMTLVVSAFISYTFLSLEALAEELESPFGTESNQLPLDAICLTIERHMLEMNDLSPLPPALAPDRHFKLT